MAMKGLLILLVLGAVACKAAEPPRATIPATPDEQRKVRQTILEELTPVALKNCTIKRYGSANDGGYLMCENLLSGFDGLYWYGIDTEDNWGCQLSAEFALPVHQYDCFTVHRPRCAPGGAIFHDECIGPETVTIRGNPFDTLANHIAKNGHAGKRVLVKMDIEDAEWDSLMATPDEVLERIDQLPMEFHGANEQQYVDVIRKLKRTFYVVSLHFNNWACNGDAAPMPGWAYQVLLVNKRLGELESVDPRAAAREPSRRARYPRAAGLPAALRTKPGVGPSKTRTNPQVKQYLPINPPAHGLV